MLNIKMKVDPQQEEEEEEEEKKILLISSCKVIEYLEPLMSKELLFKFPDNSVLDFDYSRSSIWSPLVPRVHSPMDLDLITPKKLSFGFGLQSDSNKKKIGSKKITSTVKKRMKMKKKNKNEVKAPDFSPTPIKASCALFSTKAWNKLLKAATKHFKKKKKKDPTCHVKLSNYLRDLNNCSTAN